MASTLRIKGLVRIANHVREEIARPISPARLDALRQTIADAVRSVDEIVLRNGTKVESLPAQSRQAYEFLKAVPLDKVQPSDDPGADSRPPGAIRFPGLARRIEGMQDTLARCSHAEHIESIRRAIAMTHENIESMMRRENIGPGQLKEQSRALRGWLAFMAAPANFDAYVAAVATARPVLEASAQADSRIHPPVLIHFKAADILYRAKFYDNRTPVALPMAMIRFPANLFQALADLMFHGRPTKQAIVAALSSEPCSDVTAELDALSGVEDRVRGAHHDLAAAFERVNIQYFAGRVARPRLVWSETSSLRKLGHYDPARDTVMISRALDSARAPEFALDFLMYHELLHKHLGTRCSGGRILAHSAEFRVQERLFKRQAEAEAFLQMLSLGS